MLVRVGWYELLLGIAWFPWCFYGVLAIPSGYLPPLGGTDRLVEVRQELALLSDNLDLSVIIPALDEGPNLAVLLPQLLDVLDDLEIRHEILVITQQADSQTIEATAQTGARVVEQCEPGYGGALLAGFATARGRFFLTMDADLSHRPVFIYDLMLRSTG